MQSESSRRAGDSTPCLTAALGNRPSRYPFEKAPKSAFAMRANQPHDNRIMKKLNLLVLLPVVLNWGCSNPADNVPAAKVSSNTNAAETATAPAGATRTYAVTPDSSKIEFVAS